MRYRFFTILPHLLIVHFLLYFSAKSLGRPAKNKILLFQDQSYGQINEPRESALKDP